MMLMIFIGEHIISIYMKVPEDIKIKFKAIALDNNTTDRSIHQICGRIIIMKYNIGRTPFNDRERYTLGNAVVAGLLFFILGIIVMALAGDAHGAAFFTGVLLLFIGIMIWIFSVVWNIAGVADRKTREWLNDK